MYTCLNRNKHTVKQINFTGTLLHIPVHTQVRGTISYNILQTKKSQMVQLVTYYISYIDEMVRMSIDRHPILVLFPWSFT